MAGFLIGTFIAICSLMVDSSVLDGFNAAEKICAVIIIILVFGIFGVILDMILQLISKIKIKIKK